MNKPPGHQLLVRMGAIAAFAVFALGLLLDLGADRSFAEEHPFLMSVPRDLFTPIVVGVMAILVLDDVRSWGASWRGLRTFADPAAIGCQRLASAAAGAIGIPTVLEGTFAVDGCRQARRQLDAVTGWMHPLLDRQYERVRTGSLGEPMLGVENPFSSRLALETALHEFDQPHTPSAPVVDEDLPDQIQHLSETLTGLAEHTSTGLAGDIHRFVAGLPEVVSLLRTIGLAMSTLLATTDGRVPETTANALWISLEKLRTRLHLAGLMLEQVEYERSFGVPYARRSA